ncbi:MAG TPA: SIMPL domain-containing protein [Pseudomonadales bacterium]|nr:SIMPL domain-containing protein [Pseudomonadales bacterium]
MKLTRSTLSRAPTLLALIFALQACTAGAEDAHAAGAAAPGRIVVNGEGEVRAAPDLARFSVAVGNEGREAQAVLEENAQRTERLLQALRDAGVEMRPIRTQGVSLQPVWGPRPRDPAPDWSPRVVGYQANNRLEITTMDLARVGELLAVAADAGANDIQGVQFSLENDRAARAEAIEMATRRAFDEAATLARAAGVAVGAVIELRLDHASTDVPMPMGGRERGMLMMDAKAMAPVPVEPGEVRVRATVSATLAIEP